MDERVYLWCLLGGPGFIYTVQRAAFLPQVNRLLSNTAHQVEYKTCVLKIRICAGTSTDRRLIHDQQQ